MSVKWPYVGHPLLLDNIAIYVDFAMLGVAGYACTTYSYLHRVYYVLETSFIDPFANIIKQKGPVMSVQLIICKEQWLRSGLSSQDEDREFKPQQQTSLKIPLVIYGRPLSKI